MVVAFATLLPFAGYAALHQQQPERSVAIQPIQFKYSTQAYESPDLLLQVFLEPTPSPEPTAVAIEESATPTPVLPAVEPEVEAAQSAPPVRAPASRASVAGVPWFVPAQWVDGYIACTARPDRYDFASYVWRASVQGGNASGWDYNSAMYIVSHEGGNDLCQFNTGGSGACGPFQLLSCPPDGLTPEGQISGAMAKWRDGGNDFYRHWLQWWGR